jgi:hypothetical protein
MLSTAIGIPQNKLCKYPAPPFAVIRYTMEIIGKTVDINPSTELAMAKLLYFRMGLICSEMSISLSTALHALCLCHQCQRFTIAQVALVASFSCCVFEPPNGKAQPQRRMKRVYFNSCPRTNAGSPIQPSAEGAVGCSGCWAFAFDL